MNDEELQLMREQMAHLINNETDKLIKERGDFKNLQEMIETIDKDVKEYKAIQSNIRNSKSL